MKTRIGKNGVERLGIYIHIPFCKKKCAYCDFYSTPRYDDDLLDRYVEALIRHFGDYFRDGYKYPVDTVYLGGGTPSVLGGKRIARLLQTLAKKTNLQKTAEITVEVNPESVDKSLLKHLKKAGVNRISMGIQSADDDELKALGRLHNFEQARQAFSLCRQICTENISVDLMFGLPGQTVEAWMHTVDRVLELGPTHISCYALKLEEGTPLFQLHPILPDDDVQAEMYLTAVEKLAQNGYLQYEISNFAKPGYQSRHNSKYWDLSEYLGFGCGAHSYFGGKRFSFVTDLQAYLDGVAGKAEILEEADELSYGNRHGEYVMLKLRTCEGIDESAFYRRFHVDFAPYAERLERYIPSGHVVHEGGVYHLTPKGFWFPTLSSEMLWKR